MKLLILSSRFPYPLEKGDKLRLYYQIRELAKYTEIHLISLTDRRINTEELAELQAYCSSIHTIYLPGWKSILKVMAGILRNSELPAQVNYFYSDNISGQIQDRVARLQPDALYCQLLRMEPYARRLPGPKYIDLMDAFSIGARFRAERGNILLKWFWRREHGKLAQMESTVQDRFEKCFIISALDKSRLLVDDNVEVVNNGIDARFFESPQHIQAAYDAVFVGNLSYYPNKQAVAYISERILPAYKMKYGKYFTVQLIGPHKDQIRQYLSNHIHAGGWYEDVREGYASGRVFLAPLFEGIGQQNKILEAMALGVPCICSPDVATALEVRDMEHCIICDDPASFAAAVDMLLRDNSLRKRLIHNANTFVKKKYSWGGVCRNLVEMIVG